MSDTILWIMVYAIVGSLSYPAMVYLRLSEDKNTDDLYLFILYWAFFITVIFWPLVVTISIMETRKK